MASRRRRWERSEPLSRSDELRGRAVAELTIDTVVSVLKVSAVNSGTVSYTIHTTPFALATLVVGSRRHPNLNGVLRRLGPGEVRTLIRHHR